MRRFYSIKSEVGIVNGVKQSELNSLSQSEPDSINYGFKVEQSEVSSELEALQLAMLALG